MLLFSILFSNLTAEVVIATKMEVLFPPKDKCFARIVSLIGKAKKTIHVQAYSFTSSVIANALIAAQQKGIVVRILVDKSQVNSPYSCISRLKGMEIRIDTKVAIAHNKVIIIDAEDPLNATTLTGSYNWTDSAENRNAENLDIFENQPAIAKVFLTNWMDRYNKSMPYQAAALLPPTTQEVLNQS